MRLSLEYAAGRFRIYAIVLNDGTIPAVEFLQRLEQDNTASAKSLVLRYKRHAELGPSFNEQQSRAIVGRENLFEFKSRRNDRLLYFYLPDGKTVLTHGFHSVHRRAQEKAEYDRAEALRDQYLREVHYDDT